MKPKSSRPAAEDASAFRLEDFLPYRLSVTGNRVSRLFARRYAEAFGLSIPEWRVMAVLGRFGAAAPGAVGVRTAMDKVKVSRAAASLVGKGLVSQSADPADGRARVLRLTRRGIAMHRAIVPLGRALEAQLAAALSAPEWAALNRALARLYAHVQAIEGPDPGEATD